MKKFRFRLQTLLRLRRQQEDEKKRAVGVLLTRINEFQQQAVQMAADIKREGENLKQQYQHGTLEMDWIAHYHRYVNHIRQSIQQRVQTIAQVQQQLAQARGELADAARQTKILEKLREKQKDRFDAELNRRERVQQDEIATAAFLQSRKTG